MKKELVMVENQKSKKKDRYHLASPLCWKRSCSTSQRVKEGNIVRLQPSTLEFLLHLYGFRRNINWMLLKLFLFVQSLLEIKGSLSLSLSHGVASRTTPRTPLAFHENTCNYSPQILNWSELKIASSALWSLLGNISTTWLPHSIFFITLCVFGHSNIDYTCVQPNHEQ